MSEANRFVGFWKILECVPDTTSADKKGVQGTIFQLSKFGDVIWKIPEDAVRIPLFHCETYEVISRGTYSTTPFLLRFGAYKGHIIDFKVDSYKPDIGIIIISEGWCSLRCKKLDDIHPEDPIELPFSLLPALEDSYFSDLTITASNNKQFNVHTCILKLSAPELDWTAKPPPLTGLPEDVIGTILHFLYAQCLPMGLEESVVKQVITAASDLKGLEPLVSMCQLYIKNLALKYQIISLVSDMHTCAAQIIDYFSNNHSSNEHSDNLTSDPAKLCFAVKSSIREAAVAGSKLLILCDLYTKRKDELSREEGHEIIRYAKSRIPIFMNQLERFLQGVKSTFSSLLPSQRQEVACYLVPEIETILDTISSLLVKVKGSLEIMLTRAEIEKNANFHIKPETLEEHMDNVLHEKELSRLRCLSQRITHILAHLQQKKENFKIMSSGNKIRSITRNLEQLMEELPIFLLRLEEVTGALDEKLEWNESQFCFKVGTSKVSEVIKKLLVHKESLQDLMLQFCDLVQRDSFSQSLVTLGLLDPLLSNATNPSENHRTEKYFQKTPKDHGYTFNLMESLCVSPPAHRNRLSKAATQLLRTGAETDMVFEVITSAESDNVVDHTSETTVESQTDPDSEPEVSKVEAHRVIIAARCDWFRRALLSGMQEDINRKIQVHNTSPFLFSLFLEYLYSGRLDCSSLTVDQLAELLLLSDRYELDSLKQACEHGLKCHLDDDSVLYFFSMADQFNAKILKSACVQFIAQHPDVMDSELFAELPDNLQTEIYDLVIYVKPQPMYLSSDKCSMSAPYSMADIEEMAANVHINSNKDLTRSESDELPLTQDSARLEAALEQLRDIVGHGMPRPQLVQLILAADYDVNRAVNFYLSSS